MVRTLPGTEASLLVQSYHGLLAMPFVPFHILEQNTHPVESNLFISMCGPQHYVSMLHHGDYYASCSAAVLSLSLGEILV